MVRRLAHQLGGSATPTATRGRKASGSPWGLDPASRRLFRERRGSQTRFELR